VGIEPVPEILSAEREGSLVVIVRIERLVEELT